MQGKITDGKLDFYFCITSADVKSAETFEEILFLHVIVCLGFFNGSSPRMVRSHLLDIIKFLCFGSDDQAVIEGKLLLH